MQDLSNRVIKGYHLLSQIGAGGFGEVYRATQEGIGREVAVKIILPQHANRPDFIRRFETEAQLVARLEHPHIVPLYDYWREPNSAYLVMRYLRGGSIRDILEASGPIDYRTVLRYVSQIASALTFAHSNGVIHRDLKSDNMLLDEAGNAYLGDFGIAKDLGTDIDLTQDAILGTPAYLAPEQIRGEVVTPQSDVYSFGILIYEMLTATKPFHDATPATVLFKQLNEPLPHLDEQIPASINRALQRATDKNPAERYADPLTFARDMYKGLATSDDVVIEVTGEIMAASTTEEIDIANINNPYKGLRAFQQADATDFYGRRELIDNLLGRLQAEETSNNFLAVVGPSGSGKSSVVKAGIVPAIKKGALPNSEDWFVVEMVPGANVLEELEAALLRVAVNPPSSLLEQLKEDERGLIRAVKRVLPDASTKLLLVIDQFEEVFTLEEQEDERTHFLKSIVTAVEEKDSPLVIVITLRADFYDQPLLYSRFGQLIRRRTELVLPLTTEELEETIVAPSKRVGMLIEPTVVSAIISDVNQQPGALPLLQYALTELFERREGRYMTMNAYEEIGGTLGALARRAEELYSNFATGEQNTARQMFLRLVTLGEGTEDTRRRVLQTELLSLDGHQDTMPNVLEAYAKYRLLTLDHDPVTRGSTVEVAHEALLRQWERLREWLADSREDLRLQRRLTGAAEEWLHSGKERSFLARGARLQQFEDWRDTTDLQVNETEREFLNNSIAEREARLEEERERQAREEMLEARSRDRLRLVVIVMTIAAIISTGLSIFAFNERQVAEEARDTAESNEQQNASLALAANARNAFIENDPQLALRLALEANEAFQPAVPEIIRVLGTTVYSFGPRLRYEDLDSAPLSVAFAPDGTLAALSAIDGTVVIWDIATGDTRWSLELDGIFITEVDFSPSGTQLVGATSDGTIRIYDVESGDETGRITAHGGKVQTVQFSPDGSQIASGGDDHLIQIWDAATGELVNILEGHPGVVLKVRYSPDGSRILSSAGDETMADDVFDEPDRSMRLWDVQTGEQIRQFPLDSGFVRTIAYSPDGQFVASGTWDSTFGGTARVFDANTGEEIYRFFGHTTPLTSVEFSPDGSQLLSAAWDRNIRVWNLERGVEDITFEGFNDRIITVKYSPNGEFLLIGTGNPGDNILTYDTHQSVETSVWLWDMRVRDEITSFGEHADWIWTVDINSDGTQVASGGGPLRLPTQEIGSEVQEIDTAVRIWDVQTGEVIQILEAHTNTVDSVLFTPDDTRLLTSSWDGLIILWDIATGERLQLYREHDGEVYDLVFNADGSQFLSASGDGTVRLWDTESGTVQQVFIGHEDAVNGIAISPDERLVASTSWDRTIRLWDLGSGEELQQFTGHTNGVNEVIFSPDGQFIVSSSWDDSIRMWNVETGEEVKQFVGHNGNTFGLAFTNDGQTLLTTSQDTTVRMWDVETTEEIHRFSQHTDWIQEVEISPDGMYAVSAAQDKTLRFWRIARTADEIIQWAEENRYIRDLSCAERERYRLDLCEE